MLSCMPFVLTACWCSAAKWALPLVCCLELQGNIYSLGEPRLLVLPKEDRNF